MSFKGVQLPAISAQIWDQKYCLKSIDGNAIDLSIDDTFERVARAVAKAEHKKQRKVWQARFFDLLQGFEFLPGGRILSGAGAGRNITLFNCFVMGTIEDDMTSIFQNVKEAALTLQMGGGIGHDFSTLRPRGAPVRGVGADASGPLSFMDVWDAMCRTIMSAGTRRGAMMGTMVCDHPDIEDFIAAKSDPDRLRMFNMSVLVSDAFIAAVKSDGAWDLTFAGKVYRTIRARDLWHKIMRATYDFAEPGVIFIDRVNARNNLNYCETIFATNPCGEQPLPPHGACLLGAVNLAALVQQPFSGTAHLDEKRLARVVRNSVRFLDNVIDISRFPLKAQKTEAKAKRRIGLGITGLADALIMCGLNYGTPKACQQAQRWMAQISRGAYLASAALAREKSPFPLFDRAAFLDGSEERCSALRDDAKVRAAITRNGLRNGLLTTIAPTGTTSLLAHNVSSGIEPVFDFSYRRRVLQADGSTSDAIVEDYAHRLFRAMFGTGRPLPNSFVSAQSLAPEDHLAMQAALQTHVDSSISKTINCPAELPFAAFEQVYLDAFDRHLKGCTTFRPNAVTGSVLAVRDNAADAGAAEVKSIRSDANPQKLLALDAPSAPVESPVNSGDIVYMSRPLERDPSLAGYTYKLKWPENDHALYVTLNDIVQDGRRRPFEIFINSKNLEHYAWTVALTRMISAVFRRGGDVSFVVDELKDVFDPRGGHWLDGQYVPSLLAAIGGIVERHLITIGFIVDPGTKTIDAEDVPDKVMSGDQGQTRIAIPHNRYCPKCQQPELFASEGCWQCRACGYSKCA